MFLPKSWAASISRPSSRTPAASARLDLPEQVAHGLADDVVVAHPVRVGARRVPAGVGADVRRAPAGRDRRHLRVVPGPGVVDQVRPDRARRVGDLGPPGVDADDELRVRRADRLDERHHPGQLLGRADLGARAGLDAADVDGVGAGGHGPLDRLEGHVVVQEHALVVEGVGGAVDDREQACLSRARRCAPAAGGRVRSVQRQAWHDSVVIVFLVLVLVVLAGLVVALVLGRLGRQGRGDGRPHLDQPVRAAARGTARRRPCPRGAVRHRPARLPHGPGGRGAGPARPRAEVARRGAGELAVGRRGPTGRTGHRHQATQRAHEVGGADQADRDRPGRPAARPTTPWSAEGDGSPDPRAHHLRHTRAGVAGRHRLERLRPLDAADDDAARARSHPGGLDLRRAVRRWAGSGSPTSW